MSGTFPRSLTNSGGGIVDPNPSTRSVFGAPEKGVGKGRVAAVDAGGRQDVHFTYNMVSSLLTLMGEVTAGELVAAKALVSTRV